MDPEALAFGPSTLKLKLQLTRSTIPSDWGV
jgi:hypothetical protein